MKNMRKAKTIKKNDNDLKQIRIMDKLFRVGNFINSYSNFNRNVLKET